MSAGGNDVGAAAIEWAARYAECHEGVTRGGEWQPCDKTAVALRYDPEESSPYPVCAYHSRAEMVPLANLLAALAARAADEAETAECDCESMGGRFGAHRDECTAAIPPARRAEDVLAEVRALRARMWDLIDWHETKADKARRLTGVGSNAVMEKAAQVHDDAARRLTALLAADGGEGS